MAIEQPHHRLLTSPGSTWARRTIIKWTTERLGRVTAGTDGGGGACGGDGGGGGAAARSLKRRVG